MCEHLAVAAIGLPDPSPQAGYQLHMALTNVAFDILVLTHFMALLRFTRV